MTASARDAMNAMAQPFRARRGTFGGASPAPKARLFDYLVAGLIPIYVWRIQDAIPLIGKLQVPMLVSIASLAAFVLGKHAMREKARMSLKPMKLAVFLLCWMVLSIPTSLYPGFSFSFVFNDFFKTFLVMLMIAASIRHVNDVERIALGNMIAAVIYCLKILTSFEINADGRLGAVLYYDANDLAMMTVCTIPLAVYFLRNGAKVWQRFFALGCSAIYVLVVARTGSRGGFLALIGVVGFLLVGFNAIPVRVRLGSVAAIGSLLLVFAGPQYWEMMKTIMNPKEDYNSNLEAGRLMVWQRGIGYLAGHPMTGVGVAAFPVAEGTISELAERQDRGIGVKWSAAHNSFVQISAELGLPGLVVFPMFLVQLFKLSWSVARAKRQETTSSTASERAFGEAMMATLVGYSIAGFFLSQAYAAYLYTTCGLICGLATISLRGGLPLSRNLPGAQRARASMPYQRMAT